ncbi:hypothetical protein STENM327S_03860 [Streptomyces tendae]
MPVDQAEVGRRGGLHQLLVGQLLDVVRILKERSAAALRRMPQDALDEVLDTMDAERATRLRRLRRRAGAASGRPAEEAAA